MHSTQCGNSKLLPSLKPLLYTHVHARAWDLGRPSQSCFRCSCRRRARWLSPGLLLPQNASTFSGTLSGSWGHTSCREDKQLDLGSTMQGRGKGKNKNERILYIFWGMKKWSNRQRIVPVVDGTSARCGLVKFGRAKLLHCLVAAWIENAAPHIVVLLGYCRMDAAMLDEIQRTQLESASHKEPYQVRRRTDEERTQNVPAANGRSQDANGVSAELPWADEGTPLDVVPGENRHSSSYCLSSTWNRLHERCHKARGGDRI